MAFNRAAMLRKLANRGASRAQIRRAQNIAKGTPGGRLTAGVSDGPRSQTMDRKDAVNLRGGKVVTNTSNPSTLTPRVNIGRLRELRSMPGSVFN
jgi:hypothetical protein